MAVRLRSYLAPSVPRPLFETLAAYLGTRLHRDVELTFDASRSGPRPGEVRPFATGEVDLAFVCATSYVWLTRHPDAPVRLVGAAWQPTDPRSQGRPVYFADVLAPRTGARSLAALAGGRIAYNDDVSLSGYHSLRRALSAVGVDQTDVTFVRSGSHLRSLTLLTTGGADAAAIDANVWRRCQREAPGLARQLAPVVTLGPYPVQQLIARSDLPQRLDEAVRDALLAAHDDPGVARALAAAEFAGFVPTTDLDYAGLRTQLDPALT